MLTSKQHTPTVHVSTATVSACDETAMEADTSLSVKQFSIGHIFNLLFLNVI